MLGGLNDLLFSKEEYPLGMVCRKLVLLFFQLAYYQLTSVVLVKMKSFRTLSRDFIFFLYLLKPKYHGASSFQLNPFLLFLALVTILQIRTFWKYFVAIPTGLKIVHKY